MKQKEYKFCPLCGKNLQNILCENEFYLGCIDIMECGFIHWDQPKLVVAVLIPIFSDNVNINIPNQNMVKHNGIVLIKRKIPPFPGKWCLPRGFVKRHSHPKAEGSREALEETGLITRVEKIAAVCNPMPGEINNMTITFISRIVGGKLQAGDDAAEVGIFADNNLPELCFRSDKQIIKDWFGGRYGTLTGEDL